jgi:hypothetical protein
MRTFRLSLALATFLTLVTPLAALAIGPLAFYTLTPCRVADTRNPDGPYGGPALSSGTTRVFVISGVCGVPVGAEAVAVNLTVVAPTGYGHITAYPADVVLPGVSTLNFSAGVPALANAAIVPLAVGANNSLAVHTFILGGGEVDLVIDVSGYYDQ